MLAGIALLCAVLGLLKAWYEATVTMTVRGHHSNGGLAYEIPMRGTLFAYSVGCTDRFVFSSSAMYVRQHGLSTSWYENGQKCTELRFRRGWLDGECRDWFSNGQIHIEGTFLLGKKQGLWKRWDPDGTLVSELYYENGTVISAQTRKPSNALADRK